MIRAGSLALAVVFTTACGAPRDAAPREAPRPPAQKLSQIDPRGRELLVAYGRGGEEWETARATVVAETAAGDPRAELFLIDNLILEMIRAYRASRIATALNDEALFERAQAELARFGEHALPMLVEMVQGGDPVVAFLGADTLRIIGTPALAPALAMLADGRDETRRRGAELIGRLALDGTHLRDASAALSQTMQSDRAWIVRAQATRSLGQLHATRAPGAPGRDAARLLLEQKLHDEDPAVSKEAIAALGAFGDERSFNELLSLWVRLERAHARDGEARHEDFFTRRAAIERALRDITGETRRLSLDAWRRRGPARGATPPSR